MRKWILTAATCAMALGVAAPAAKADPWGYGGPQYRGGYGYGERHHRRGFDGGDALLGGAIGLAAGALLGSALSQPQPAPVYRDPYAQPYGRPTYARPSYAAPVYVDPPSYEDTVPQRVYRDAPRRVEYRDRSTRGHIEACLDRYGSYDPRTDTYLGYDGYRHRCNL